MTIRMNYLSRIVVFLSLACYTKADLCHNNFTLSELPHGLLADLISILTEGTIIEFLGCQDGVKIDESDVKLWLYTRNNPDVPISLKVDNPVELDPSKKIKMIIPGWLCNITNSRVPELKNAYLDAADYNVIAVEWTTYAIDLYVKSYCYVPEIAKYISRLFCNLHQNQTVDLNTVHVVGHSMGGQMSGWIGQEVQSRCQQKIGRITGLDPAGPIFQHVSINRRLDESDAEFVDVIHTNQNYLGYYGKAGKVDFYPNCGTFQSGCLKVNGKASTRGLISLTTAVVTCNHFRALDYMLESVNSDQFVGKSCRLCPGVPFLGVCARDPWPSSTIMGENANPNPPYSTFQLKTNPQPPFGRG